MAKPSDDTTIERRRKCLSASVSEWLEPTLLPMLKKHGLAEGRLFSRWNDIIGPQLAQVCFPCKLRYPRGEKRNGTLHLRVAPGWQTALHHSSPEIIEKIAVYFGYRAVEQIRLIPDHHLQGGKKMPRPAPPLSAAASQRLNETLAAIEDTALHAKLSALGRAVISRKERLERERKAP